MARWGARQTETTNADGIPAKRAGVVPTAFQPFEQTPPVKPMFAVQSVHPLSLTNTLELANCTFGRLVDAVVHRGRGYGQRTWLKEVFLHFENVGFLHFQHSILFQDKKQKKIGGRQSPSVDC